MPGTRKLGRPTAHRRSMLRGQVTYLLENGSLKTTVTRAKELRSVTEKMITLGKKNTLAARRQALAFITKEDVVKKLFDVIAPSFEGRNGGYTRVLKLGQRRGDGAEMAIIELLKEEKKEKKSASKKPAAKKPAAKKAAAPAKKNLSEAEPEKEEKAEEVKDEVKEEVKEEVKDEVKEAPAEPTTEEQA